MSPPSADRDTGLLPQLITKLVGWAVALFYEVERTGPPLAEGPVLVTANHPNALVDPLVVFRTGGRVTRPLAKAPLFDQALVGTVLRGLGGLPVYRKQDDPALMHLNERTFDAAIQALRAGEAVQIFPEGLSHSEPSLAPVKTGAARIALQAEAGAGWALGLHIQPVGLTYTRKHLFRGRVVAAFGTPFVVAAYRAAYEADEREGVERVTGEIRRRLEELTLNFDDPAERDLVEVAERLYSREKRLVRWEDRPGMAERMPRLRRFADGLRWLKATDPERHARLVRAVSRYLRLVTFFGASEGDVPPRYRWGKVLRYTLTQSAAMVLLLPLALTGTALWALPYLGTRHVWPLFRPKLDQVATYKLGTALLAFPLWLFVLTGAGMLLWGVRLGLLVLVGAPATGMAAVAWKEREARAREDVTVFLRAARSRKGRDRLAELRARLVAEFDGLAAAWDAGKVPPP
ncbi:MAG: 1-acyl-sn-glycerol-3-phosphate acyltransferase [Longimicrobiales bacterium]|nr:1-acyl-sn-glycerol-3-phosphate acyltransferase [Longimicrobiales bacterium]